MKRRGFLKALLAAPAVPLAAKAVEPPKPAPPPAPVMDETLQMWAEAGRWRKGIREIRKMPDPTRRKALEKAWDSEKYDAAVVAAAKGDL